MTINRDALWKAVVLLAKIEQMRLTTKCTLVGATAAAIAGMAGFALLGPIGPVIGSSIAGLTVAGYYKNKFKPVYVILKEDLSPQQREELLDLLSKAFSEADLTDALQILVLFNGERSMLESIKTIIGTFLTKELMNSMSGKVTIKSKEMTAIERDKIFREQFMMENGLSRQSSPTSSKF